MRHVVHFCHRSIQPERDWGALSLQVKDTPWCTQSHLPLQTLWNEGRGGERRGEERGILLSTACMLWDREEHGGGLRWTLLIWRAVHIITILYHNYHISVLSSSPSILLPVWLRCQQLGGGACHASLSSCLRHDITTGQSEWLFFVVMSFGATGRPLQQQLVLPGSSTDLLLLSHPYYP